MHHHVRSVASGSFEKHLSPKKALTDLGPKRENTLRKTAFIFLVLRENTHTETPLFFQGPKLNQNCEAEFKKVNLNESFDLRRFN